MEYKVGDIVKNVGPTVGSSSLSYWIKRGCLCIVSIHPDTGSCYNVGTILTMTGVVDRKSNVSVRAIDPECAKHNTDRHRCAEVWVPTSSLVRVGVAL